jgi:hypothetical protein
MDGPGHLALQERIMAVNGAPRESTRFVAMFQKAHSHIAALQRVDEQIAVLMEQRRKVAEDLRTIQTQINSEFHRVLETYRTMPPEARPQTVEDLVFEEMKAPVELKPSVRESKPVQRTAALQVAG